MGKRGIYLCTEFDRAMAYCGRTRVSQLDRSLLNLPCACWTRR